MALDLLNRSNLEQLALKGLTGMRRRPGQSDNSDGGARTAEGRKRQKQVGQEEAAARTAPVGDRRQ